MKAETRITEILLASSPDRDDLVAEFWSGDEHWGMLFNEHGRMVLHIFPDLSGAPWVLELDHLLESLTRAKRRLLGEPADQP